MPPDTAEIPHFTPSVTAGLVPDKELVKQLGVSDRTIARYRAQGMPVIVVGNQRWSNPESVSAWLKSCERRRNEPRRGRPAKKVA